MSKIVVFVPRGRRFCGHAFLLGADGATRAGPFRALATASVRVAKKHGNADASPLLPFGHPPQGTYVVSASLPPGYVHTKRKRRYGHVGGLLLAPRSGDALRATANGRKLVALHGGPLDVKRRLRPTRGGIRFSNKQMRALLGAMNAAQSDGDPVSSVERVEVEMELGRKRDKKGKHALRKKKDAKAAPAPRGGGGFTPMILLPFALGGAGQKSMKRREMLRAAGVVLGALAIQACNRPSNCSPLYCPAPDADAGDAGADAGDAGDAGGRVRCTPEGYVCYGGVG